MHEAASSADARIGLIPAGFSPPGPLAAIAPHLGWPGLVLADPGRVLCRRLGAGGAHTTIDLGSRSSRITVSEVR